MEQFFENQKLPEFKQDERHNMNSPVNIKEIECII